MLKELRASYSEYDKSINFVLIAWDTFSNHFVPTSRKIPRRSPLELIKGGNEVGRLVAQAGVKEIKALLDSGLK